MTEKELIKLSNEKIIRQRKDLTIIFLFAKAIGAKLEGKQKQSFIKRYIRAAKLLEDYPLRKVEVWLKILPYLNMKKWTLETVGKFIDYDPIDIIEKYNPKDCVKIFEELTKEGILKYTKEGFSPNW